MFIPSYWSEASRTERMPGKKSVSVHRFGWSATSQMDADVHARARLEEALAVLRLGGEKELGEFTRRERKVAYSGADGLPIREEIVAARPEIDVVLTRNSYGAVCLNTTSGVFVDVDAVSSRVFQAGCLGTVVGALIGLILGLIVFPKVVPLPMLAGAIVAGIAARATRRLIERGDLRQHDPSAWSIERSRVWCETRPGWRVAVYETPGGARLLLLHATFDAEDETAFEFMKFVGVDALYERMCRIQKCFRARVSPKPWNVGMKDHFRAGGTWPVTNPQKLAARAEWVSRYEIASQSYASCRKVKEIGQGTVNARVAAIRRLHDELCRADSLLPLA